MASQQKQKVFRTPLTEYYHHWKKIAKFLGCTHQLPFSRSCWPEKNPHRIPNWATKTRCAQGYSAFDTKSPSKFLSSRNMWILIRIWLIKPLRRFRIDLKRLSLHFQSHIVRGYPRHDAGRIRIPRGQCCAECIVCLRAFGWNLCVAGAHEKAARVPSRLVKSGVSCNLLYYVTD
jgi:hypothetical protein